MLDEANISAPQNAEPKSHRSIAELDREGDIAADYIEELLDIADVDGDIVITVKNDRAYVSVTDASGKSVKAISDNSVVLALQELTRLAVHNKTGIFSRIILDIGDSRAARENTLKQLVHSGIASLEEGATTASLPAMTSYERKLVHDLVAEAGFASESQGEGRDRHVLISRGE